MVDLYWVLEEEVTVEEIIQGENKHVHIKVVDLHLANKGGVTALNQNPDNIYLTNDEFSDFSTNNDKFVVVMEENIEQGLADVLCNFLNDINTAAMQ